MQQRLQKYGSLFLLLLFLFPLIEKGIHTFEHAGEERCVASDKHLHEQQHSCSICDFTLSNPHFIADADVVIIPNVHRIYFQPFTQSIHIPEAFQDLPSRAPPIC
ncbi:MAG TPA: hypothetical protein VFF27_18350 [Bacteroidia bacterium]|jgi:hypothetical protein|nr:hypothetical protein [Bacteroidia bacterium]